MLKKTLVIEDGQLRTDGQKDPFRVSHCHNKAIWLAERKNKEGQWENTGEYICSQCRLACTAVEKLEG